MPSLAVAASGGHKTRHAAIQNGGMLPDPADFAPGDDAHAALSDIVARPGSVLDAYAPMRRDGGGLRSRRRRRGRSPPPRAMALADRLRRDGCGRPRSRPSSPAAAPVAGPAGPDPLAYGPVSPDAPVLDAATLRQALDTWVGPEPLRGLRSIPAAVAEEKRHDARAAVRDFYAERGFAPLWVVDGHFDAQARSAVARIDHAAEDGLDLRATPVTVPQGGDPEALAAAELSLTAAVVDYGRQASGGRIDPSRIDALVAVKPEVAPPGARTRRAARCFRCRRGLAGLQPAPSRLSAAPRQAGRDAARVPTWPIVARSRPVRR